MLEHSSNHSSRSNLFNLSSESEKSHHKPKKTNYSSFVRKVRHLLQAEGDDLQQLFQKVEVIVRKYFKDNKIVEFSEMYNHIICLKSNSKKMTQIVNLLQTKISEQQKQKQKKKLLSSRYRQDRVQEFQITSSTQKESKPSIPQKQNINQEDMFNKLEQSTGTVVNSIKYKYQIKPSFNNKHQVSRQSKIKESQNRQQKQKNSPQKRNTSYEQYMKRNRQYNDKVKELMQELTDIKHSLPNNEEDVRTIEMEGNNNRIKQELGFELDISRQEIVHQNYDRVLEEVNQKAMKDASYQTQIQLNIQHKQHSLTNNVQNKKQNASSVNTIADSPEKELIQERQVNIERSKQIRKKQLLEQANKITLQLQQLKQVAYYLQSQPKEKESQKIRIETGQISSQQTLKNNSKIDELKQQNEKQLLEKISNTSSRIQPTEEMIPSFKQLKMEPLDLRAVQAQTIYPSGSQLNGSVFSFSNTEFQKQVVENPLAFKKTGSQVVRTDVPIRLEQNYQNIPLQVSIVKKGFNPYQSNHNQSHPPNSNYNHPPNPNYNNPQYSHPHTNNSYNPNNPLIRYQRAQNARPYSTVPNQNKMIVKNQMNSHQTNQTAQPLIIPQQNRSLQVMNAPRNRSTSRQNQRFAHLHRAQSEQQPNQKMIKSSFTYSNRATSNMTNSWSGQRKGINLMSPPPVIM